MLPLGPLAALPVLAAAAQLPSLPHSESDRAASERRGTD
jgi:hypothetical protein